MVKMEASKCPKCGDEPHYLEHVERWYCYGCNSYLEDDVANCGHTRPDAPPETTAAPAQAEECARAIAAELESLEREDAEVVCPKCGAELEEIKDGKLFCYICESYADEAKSPLPATNEPQSLLDSAAVSLCDQAATIVPQPAKPAAPSPAVTDADKKIAGPDVRTCGTCGQTLKWIEKYQRHYCYGCRKYAPKDVGPRTETQTAAREPPVAEKRCPDCGGELRFIEKYKEHYCYTCKKYPFHKKPEKSAQEAVSAASPRSPVCAKCGEPLKYIEKYQRHYCFKCREYAPKESAGAQTEPKVCPSCGEKMRFIKEYNEWYCYTCKRYSLRPTKPVLLA